MAELGELSSISNSGSVKSTADQAQGTYGIYRAICVDVEDPLKSGRVKVSIPKLSMTETNLSSDGVWAYPCTPYAAPNLEKDGEPVADFGALYVPPKDSYVFVFFEDGDSSKPRYFGGCVLENGVPTENRNGEQPWNKHMVIKTPAKRTIFVSDDESTDACILIRGKQRGGE